MWGTIIAVVLVLVVVGVVVWYFFFYKKRQEANTKVFAVDYSNVSEPYVAVVDDQPVKPEINPANVLFFHNYVIYPMTGDTLQLRENSNTMMVVAKKTLELDRYMGTGDWSLLENLEAQLRTEGYFNANYKLELVRNGDVVMSHVLDNKYVYIEWFGSDFRQNGAYTNRNPPFVLGDVVFIADGGSERTLEYLYYCIDDRSGLFQMHSLSPMRDAPAVATFDQLREQFRSHFIGYADAEMNEIQEYPAQHPGPPTEPIVINTADKYPALYLKDPVAGDPLVLDMTAANIITGDSVQINDANNNIYYEINDLQLTNEPTSEELTNDLKYLTSGVVQLIRNNDLYGFNLLVKRGAGAAATTVLSKVIPADCQGVKFYSQDFRVENPKSDLSAVISDIVKAMPSGVSPAPAPITLWCVDGAARTYTDGKDFTGTLYAYPKYLQSTYPTIDGMQVKVNAQNDPTVFLTMTFPVNPPPPTDEGKK